VFSSMRPKLVSKNLTSGSRSNAAPDVRSSLRDDITGRFSSLTSRSKGRSVRAKPRGRAPRTRLGRVVVMRKRITPFSRISTTGPGSALQGSCSSPQSPPAADPLRRPICSARRRFANYLSTRTRSRVSQLDDNELFIYQRLYELLVRTCRRPILRRLPAVPRRVVAPRARRMRGRVALQARRWYLGS